MQLTSPVHHTRISPNSPSREFVKNYKQTDTFETDKNITIGQPVGSIARKSAHPMNGRNRISSLEVCSMRPRTSMQNDSYEQVIEYNNLNDKGNGHILSKHDINNVSPLVHSSKLEKEFIPHSDHPNTYRNNVKSKAINRMGKEERSEYNTKEGKQVSNISTSDDWLASETSYSDESSFETIRNLDRYNKAIHVLKGLAEESLVHTKSKRHTVSRLKQPTRRIHKEMTQKGGKDIIHGRKKGSTNKKTKHTVRMDKKTLKWESDKSSSTLVTQNDSYDHLSSFVPYRCLELVHSFACDTSMRPGVSAAALAKFQDELGFSFVPETELISDTQLFTYCHTNGIETQILRQVIGTRTKSVRTSSSNLTKIKSTRLGNQTNNQTIRQPGNQTTSQTDNQTIRQSGNQTIRQSGNQTIRQSGNQTIRQSGNRTTSQSGNQLVNTRFQELPSHELLRYLMPSTARAELVRLESTFGTDFPRYIERAKEHEQQVLQEFGVISVRGLYQLYRMLKGYDVEATQAIVRDARRLGLIEKDKELGIVTILKGAASVLEVLTIDCGNVTMQNNTLRQQNANHQKTITMLESKLKENFTHQIAQEETIQSLQRKLLETEKALQYATEANASMMRSLCKQRDIHSSEMKH